MLHIKLPKGKVAQACERAAEEATRRIVRDNERDVPNLSEGEWRAAVADRNKLQAMADMAKHSVGDVYVNPELWGAIRGVYDV